MAMLNIFQALNTRVSRGTSAENAQSETEKAYLLNIEKRYSSEKGYAQKDRIEALESWIDGIKAQHPKQGSFLWQRADILEEKLFKMKYPEKWKAWEEAIASEAATGKRANYSYLVPSSQNYSIEVRGDREGYVRKALDLLAEKSPESLEFAGKYLRRIDVSPMNENAFHYSDRGFHIGSYRYCTFYDGYSYRLAGDIAHEAQHGKNLEDGVYLGESGENATKNELSAINYSAKVLKLVGAPQGYIDMVLSNDGRHWDENNDNLNNYKDWEIRRKREREKNKLIND